MNRDVRNQIKKLEKQALTAHNSDTRIAALNTLGRIVHSQKQRLSHIYARDAFSSRHQSAERQEQSKAIYKLPYYGNRAERRLASRTLRRCVKKQAAIAKHGTEPLQELLQDHFPN